MLAVNAVTKTYASVPALSNVSFTISPGEVLGYLGPNGSGKSTTVKIVAGLLEPTLGEVRFRGQNIRDDLAAYKRILGYVPEEANLYPFLSGLEYLQLVGRLRGLSERLIDHRANELLRILSLHPHRHVAMSSYSKGMRQRVLLISALMHNPDLIIFDEPQSGLDVTSALIFHQLIAALQGEGKMVLYCSHVLEVVEKVCSHVTILQKGRQLAYGTVGELKRFQSMPTLEAAFSHLVKEADATEAAQHFLEVISNG